jgi:hypothetical protein
VQGVFQKRCCDDLEIAPIEDNRQEKGIQEFVMKSSKRGKGDDANVNADV